MDSPQIPHRDAELLRYLHLRRAGPMEAIPVGVPPGQLSRSLVNPEPVSRLLLWSPSEQVFEGKYSSENRNLTESRSTRSWKARRLRDVLAGRVRINSEFHAAHLFLEGDQIGIASHGCHFQSRPVDRLEFLIWKLRDSWPAGNTSGLYVAFHNNLDGANASLFLELCASRPVSQIILPNRHLSSPSRREDRHLPLISIDCLRSGGFFSGTTRVDEAGFLSACGPP